MDKIFILDAVNFLFRSYYAIGPMTNDEGKSTSALFGFIRTVKKLINDFNPNYIVSVFDGPDNKKSRRTVYAEYKMHRKGAPEDLYPQFELAYDFCNLFGIPVLCVEGVEADDTMASVAKWAVEKEHMQAFLCTSDKDLFQMVGENTFVIHAHKDNLIVDSKKVEELYGVRPDQMLDFLSIAGDSSDNIPGIPGFGPKTAQDLLQKFNTLDEILAHPEKVSGKKQEILIKEKDKAIMSRQLATLNFEVEFPHQKEFFALKKPKIEELKTFFQKMRFAKFLQELQPLEEKAEHPLQKEEALSYHLVNSKESLLALMEKLSKIDEICLDTETSSENPLLARLIGIGLGFKEKEAFYIPLNGSIDESFILENIKKLSHKKVFGHNIKYDLQVLANYSIVLENISFDTILASYLISPHHNRHGLDYLALEHFQKVKISFKELTHENKKKILLKDVAIDKVANYCCEDVDYTIRLKNLFEKELEEKKLTSLLQSLEIPLIPILAKMERHGIFIDVEHFYKMEKELKKELADLEREIFHLSGLEFNLNSPKQLSEVLFQKLQLPPPKRKKTEFSTGADVLEKLAPKSLLVRKILEYRGVQKLLSTYVEALPKQIDPFTSRIHTTFNQSVTATGRLSCQNPNLQNIPVKTDAGLNIRKGFKPQKPSWSYVGADYSQIELRLLAHFSEDEELIKAFKENQDIHSHTASLIYKVPLSEVTDEMRRSAKTVNFGILYGQGAYGLSEQLNISHHDAANLIKTYFERYPKVLSFIEKCKEEVAKTKVSKTLLGRQRPIPDIDSKNPSIKAFAQRLAVNTPLQGTAADIIKMAMIEIDKSIAHLKGYMILQIHDELIFEVPEDEIEIFQKIIKDKMENAISLKVPLTVNLQVGKNWAEC